MKILDDPTTRELVFGIIEKAIMSPENQSAESKIQAALVDLFHDGVTTGNTLECVLAYVRTVAGKLNFNDVQSRFSKEFAENAGKGSTVVRYDYRMKTTDQLCYISGNKEHSYWDYVDEVVQEYLEKHKPPFERHGRYGYTSIRNSELDYNGEDSEDEE